MSTENKTGESMSATDTHAVASPADSVHTMLLTMSNGAAVWGPDGELGPMLAIVIDPSTKTATEIAVRNGDVAGTGRMIPVSDVVSATRERIDVTLDRSHFFSLERFLVPYLSATVSKDDPSPEVAADSDVWLIRPGTFLFAVHENVPSGEVPVHRGMAVFNSAGRRAGKVEGWNFHPGSGQLASLIFEAHHLLGRRHMLVDASSIESIDRGGVRLTLSAADLGDLRPLPGDR